jgi:dihydrodipicolinate synthase/N-acetylneuraminate lyase
MRNPISAAREQLLRGTFPGGVPRLWCPPLTHYASEGAIDTPRMAAHFRHMSPYVGGFLIPGSTGDGWELTQAERRHVLTIGIEHAQQFKRYILIGALNPNLDETLALIREDLDWLKSRFGESDTTKVLAQARVCGFTICPPRGKELDQEEIHRALAGILDLGLPTAIYQLPQVTENEMSPEVANRLAMSYANFIFFKDTSGSDTVVLSGEDLGGVFTARGAEGGYARWPKPAGGVYDGFLLASANCFARELHQIVNSSVGKSEGADQLSERLTGAVLEILRLASGLPAGNPFTNANKAMDHFFAHGPEAVGVPPPRLHAGSRLPIELIRSTGDILSRQKLMPSRGYLEQK